MDSKPVLHVSLLPGKRCSNEATPQIRIACREPGILMVVAVQGGRRVKLLEAVTKGGLACHCYDIPVRGLRGKYVFEISLMTGSGELLKTEESYTILHSGTHSGLLIDGCWVSIYHWSEDEGRRFNKALAAMTDEDWKQKVRDMARVGITSVLIQNVFLCNEYCYAHDMTSDDYHGEAFYDSKLFAKRAPIAAKDPIEAILQAADECDMTVFPGIGSYAWFDFTEESLIWHKRVAREVFGRYGHHKSFYGWYISEEMFGDLYYTYPGVDFEKHRDVIHFFKEFTAYAHNLAPTKPVALAPNNIDFHLFEKQWLKILKNIDIILPFAFARSPEKYNVKEIAAICEKAGTRFWVDMEMFKYPFPDGLAPKTVDELIEEIRSYDMLEQIYGYQYTGHMNAPEARVRLGGEETVELYGKYLEYYTEIMNKYARGEEHTP